MKFLLAKKIEMSQLFKKEGTVVPVTWIEAGPCFVVDIFEKNNGEKKKAQIGFEKKKKNIKKTEKGKEYKYLKEFEIKDQEIKKGDQINVSIFKEGDIIKTKLEEPEPTLPISLLLNTVVVLSGPLAFIGTSTSKGALPAAFEK